MRTIKCAAQFKRDYKRENIDDRVLVPEITKRITGLLFGDKGYIKQELFDELYVRGRKLVTGIKKNMKNKLMLLIEKILLRKRSIFDFLGFTWYLGKSRKGIIKRVNCFQLILSFLNL